jgi:hypothetical protein
MIDCDNARTSDTGRMSWMRGVHLAGGRKMGSEKGRATGAIACGLGLALLAATADAGKFVVRPPDVKSEQHQELVQAMTEGGVLDEVAKAVNAIFVIPQDVGLKFLECGESNAYFSSEDMEISMCIELWEDMYSTLAESYPDEDERQTAVVGAFMAILMHEVGHALVAVLDLPITGREEDAVDQLAAWVLIEADDAESVLSSAATYYTAEEEANDDDLSDEHSLNQQRYFNMVCWVYGSDTEKHADLLEDWGLPESRADQCESEYQTLRNAWSRLLKDHLRDPETANTAVRGRLN